MQHDPGESHILICDDSITNVMMIQALLKSEGYTQADTVTDPRKVSEMMEKQEYDLLILDLEMPHMTGMEVMAEIRGKQQADEVLPILILTGKQGADVRNEALAKGANDFVNKPIDQVEVVLRAKNLLQVRAAWKQQRNLSNHLEKMVQDRTDELSKATEILLNKLASAGELRDNDTGKHVLRVGLYSRLMAEKIGLPEELCFMIEKTAPMHDIGKIGIPDGILLKPDKLSDEEYERMKEHTLFGEKLLQDTDSMLIQMASVIAVSHHEKWDGSGYPHGLKGESIPIEGRITAISDVFDALTSKRPYKKDWTFEDAVEEITSGSGSHFDPNLVKIMQDNLEEFREIYKHYQDNKA